MLINDKYHIYSKIQKPQKLTCQDQNNVVKMQSIVNYDYWRCCIQSTYGNSSHARTQPGLVDLILPKPLHKINKVNTILQIVVVG